MMTDNGILARCEYLFSQNKWISPTNVKSLIHFAKMQKAELKRLKAENERLRTECGNQSNLWSKHYEGIFETAKETIKSEARKEIIEKIKSKFTHKGKSIKYGEFAWDDVKSYELDNLLKEMESESNV